MAIGLDGFPYGMLRDSLRSGPPLAFLINLSLQTGTVSPMWQVAKVIPLFIDGSRTDVNNYRPMSVLPVMSKILEKLVHKQLLDHLEKTIYVLVINLAFVQSVPREQFSLVYPKLLTL